MNLNIENRSSAFLASAKCCIEIKTKNIAWASNRTKNDNFIPGVKATRKKHVCATDVARVVLPDHPFAGYSMSVAPAKNKSHVRLRPDRREPRPVPQAGWWSTDVSEAASAEAEEKRGSLRLASASSNLQITACRRPQGSAADVEVGCGSSD